MVVCTFAGHREVFGLGQSRVVDILERLLEAEIGRASCRERV